MTELTIREHDTNLLIHCGPDDEKRERLRRLVIEHLNARGFALVPRADVSELIRDNYLTGRKGDLRVDIETWGYPTEIEFFQDVVHENRHGGRYDFDKREKMPYLIGKQYELERNKLIALLIAEGGRVDPGEPDHTAGMDFINARRASLTKSHHGYYDREPDAYNSRTAARGTVRNGDTVYMLRRGRFVEGTAYHNINNMWWVLMPSGEVTNRGCFELYHRADVTRLRGRQFGEDDAAKAMQRALLDAVKAGNLAKIASLRAALTPDDGGAYVISLKETQREDRHITLWAVADCGYRSTIEGAGKYSLAHVMRCLGYYNSGCSIAVDAATVERLCVVPKGSRDGARAYLPNNRATWTALLAAVVAPPQYEPKPRYRGAPRSHK